jgi:hypothetical protein
MNVKKIVITGFLVGVLLLGMYYYALQGRGVSNMAASLQKAQAASQSFSGAPLIPTQAALAQASGDLDSQDKKQAETSAENISSQQSNGMQRLVDQLASGNAKDIRAVTEQIVQHMNAKKIEIAMAEKDRDLQKIKSEIAKSRREEGGDTDLLSAPLPAAHPHNARSGQGVGAPLPFSAPNTYEPDSSAVPIQKPRLLAVNVGDKSAVLSVGLMNPLTEMVHEGDEFNGSTVTKIAMDYVMLISNGVKQTIRLSIPVRELMPPQQQQKANQVAQTAISNTSTDGLPLR